MSARTIGAGRQQAKTPRWSLPACIPRVSRPGGRPFCPVPPGPRQAQSTAPALAAAGQRQPDGLAGLAALRAQAAALTARRQSEKDAICLIPQINAELALTKADAARCEREGDLAPAAARYEPAAGLELRRDAAAKALGDLQAGQRMRTQEAGTRGGPRRLAPARPCRCVSR
jgi:hypothetical protein